MYTYVYVFGCAYIIMQLILLPICMHNGGIILIASLFKMYITMPIYHLVDKIEFRISGLKSDLRRSKYSACITNKPFQTIVRNCSYLYNYKYYCDKLLITGLQ